jgi:predicted DNA-binding protein
MPLSGRRKTATLVSSFRLPARLVQRARKLAELRRWTLAEYLRYALERAVEADEKKDRGDAD